MIAAVKAETDPREKERKLEDALKKLSFLVDVTISRTIKYIPYSMERDDLVNAGRVALAKCINYWNPGRKVQFRTYAITSIRRAILREMDKLSWSKSGVASEYKILGAIAKLKDKLGRNPFSSEIIEELGITKSKYDRMIASIAFNYQGSLSEASNNDCQDSDNTNFDSPINLIKDDVTSVMAQILYVLDLEGILKIVEDMSETHHAVFECMLCGNTVKETAEELGLPMSRVSAIMSSIRETLSEIDIFGKLEEQEPEND